jgi:hypothetical protein
MPALTAHSHEIYRPPSPQYPRWLPYNPGARRPYRMPGELLRLFRLIDHPVSLPSMNYFIGKNGQQLGPFSEEQVRDMVRGGMVSPEDLGWHQGTTAWVPLHQLLGAVPASAPSTPPPITGGATAKSAHQGHVGENPPSLAIGTALWWLIASCIMGLVVTLFAPPQLTWATFVPLVAYAVYFSILHYRCWNSLPQPFRATTPGKAVGFLFIPFFNLYWAFVTWPKLAKGVVEWQKSRGYQPTENLELIALGYAAVHVFGFLMALGAPEVAVVADFAAIFLFFIFYSKTIAALNALNQGNEPGTQALATETT